MKRREFIGTAAAATTASLLPTVGFAENETLTQKLLKLFPKVDDVPYEFFMHSTEDKEIKVSEKYEIAPFTVSKVEQKPFSEFKKLLYATPTLLLSYGQIDVTQHTFKDLVDVASEEINVSSRRGKGNNLVALNDTKLFMWYEGNGTFDVPVKWNDNGVFLNPNAKKHMAFIRLEKPSETLVKKMVDNFDGKPHYL